VGRGGGDAEKAHPIAAAITARNVVYCLVTVTVTIREVEVRTQWQHSTFNWFVVA
jgi:hypothetical protein